MSLPVGGLPVLLDAGVALRLDASARVSAVLATLISRNVSVAAVRDHSLAVGVVVKSVAHETTIAATVALGGAVNHLLLGQCLIAASVNIVERLKLGNSSEGPAGTAAALILDVADGAADTPVNTTVLILVLTF